MDGQDDIVPVVFNFGASTRQRVTTPRRRGTT